MFDLSYFIGKSYFDDNESLDYLILQVMFKPFKIFTGSIDKSLE